MLEVLYEDNHLIAVWKPAGQLTQSDQTGDLTLADHTKKYLKEKYRKPGNVFLGILHRLDRPVSGIVLFAKTSKGAARLSLQIRNRDVQKTYRALVSGSLPSSGRLINYILRDRRTNTVKIYHQPKPQALQAILSYQVLNHNHQQSLIQIQLKTGRHHQIRAQLANFGHPIVGDKKYGSHVIYQPNTIALSAVALGFYTATTHQWKLISKIPAIFNAQNENPRHD